MEDVLNRRYATMFLAYDAGGVGGLQEIKHLLIDPVRRGLMRADAALCLLTLFDQMILRPYVGSLQSVNGMEELPLPDVARRGEFGPKVINALQLILGSIEQDSKSMPASSHDVLRAIDRSWGGLAPIFGWA